MSYLGAFRTGSDPSFALPYYCLFSILLRASSGCCPTPAGGRSPVLAAGVASPSDCVSLSSRLSLTKKDIKYKI